MRFLIPIVLVLFAAFVSALPVSQSDYKTSGQQDVINAINGMRRQRGLNPLTVSQCLNSIAASDNQKLGNTGYGYKPISSDFQPYNPNGNSCSKSLNNVMELQLPALVNGAEFANYLQKIGTFNSLLEDKVTYIGIDVIDPASSVRYWTILYSS
jgi:hypothetical protein